MFLIFIGAIIGALFGSIPGAIIGGLIGYGAGIALKRSVVGGLRVVQSKLIDSTFSVMGALCKADKVVTRDEIQAVERAFDMFKLSGEQREQAKAAFTRGKQPGFDLDAAVDQIIHQRADVAVRVLVHDHSAVSGGLHHPFGPAG